MANQISPRRKTKTPQAAVPGEKDACPKPEFLAETARILDAGSVVDLIRDRQVRGVDTQDEVWEGVYVVPPLANLAHQDLVIALSAILFHIINLEGRGRVQAGANVSDRRSGWEHNYRSPDIVVALRGGQAVDCTTHWFGGPDCLIEVQSPGDETDQKIPFYSQIRVQELLIIHRDTRQLQLYRHDGQQLVLVESTDFQGGNWLVSQVVPLAFRRKASRRNPRIEVQRTDGQPGSWTV
jgi:Uma2 family endonuclease